MVIVKSPLPTKPAFYFSGRFALLDVARLCYFNPFDDVEHRVVG